MKTFLLKFPASLIPVPVLNLIILAIAFIIASSQNSFAQSQKSGKYSSQMLQPRLTICNEGVAEKWEEPVIENEILPDQAIRLHPHNDNYSAALNPGHTLIPGTNYVYSGLGGATLQPGEYTGCFNPAPDHTVWFSFFADQSSMWIAVKPSYLVCPTSFAMAVYPASINLPTNPVACLNYFPANNSNFLSKLELTGLNVGSTYVVQLAFRNNTICNSNLYNRYGIKIGHPASCITCADICGPICALTGPNPPTANQVKASCPAFDLQPPVNNFDIQTRCYSFTAPNDTVYLQQIVNSYCSPGNTLIFTYSLYNSTCVFIQSGNVFANNGITNLSPGQTYKLCFTLQSACTWDSLSWPYVYAFSPVPARLPLGSADLSIVPNPAMNDITVSYSLPQNTSGIFEFSDMNGKNIFKRTLPALSTSQKINISSLHPGIYFYTVKDAKGNATHGKLVKE
ncbi:MAG TPA: T9SS type A sorting domain-containing protein [Bacteroidia bacterium]|nr:T9SS type A sorting domain-containing protein [Bacteroidia bacterium]